MVNFYILIIFFFYPFCVINFKIPREGPAGAQHRPFLTVNDAPQRDVRTPSVHSNTGHEAGRQNKPRETSNQS